MSKKIRDIDGLPDWFSIEPYKEWANKEPYLAAQAVEDRFALKELLDDLYFRWGKNPSQDVSEAAIKWLVNATSKPFDRVAVDPIAIRIFEDLDPASVEPERGMEADQGEEIEFKKIVSKKAEKIFPESFFEPDKEKVTIATLYDAMVFLEENKEKISEIEKEARALSTKYDRSYEEVRASMFSLVKITDNLFDGSFVYVDGLPTIEKDISNIRQYALKKYGSGLANPKVKNSEVRKLFEYRASAYIVLKIWSSLAGCQITAKCMAKAIFPDGEYGELDMQPSRTLGKFYNRLWCDREYLFKLVHKAAEIENLQF